MEQENHRLEGRFENDFYIYEKTRSGHTVITQRRGEGRYGEVIISTRVYQRSNSPKQNLRVVYESQIYDSRSEAEEGHFSYVEDVEKNPEKYSLYNLRQNTRLKEETRNQLRNYNGMN